MKENKKTDIFLPTLEFEPPNSVTAYYRVLGLCRMKHNPITQPSEV